MLCGSEFESNYKVVLLKVKKIPIYFFIFCAWISKTRFLPKKNTTFQETSLYFIGGSAPGGSNRRNSTSLSPNSYSPRTNFMLSPPTAQPLSPNAISPNASSPHFRNLAQNVVQNGVQNGVQSGIGPKNNNSSSSSGFVIRNAKTSQNSQNFSNYPIKPRNTLQQTQNSRQIQQIATAQLDLLFDNKYLAASGPAGSGLNLHGEIDSGNTLMACMSPQAEKSFVMDEDRNLRQIDPEDGAMNMNEYEKIVCMIKPESDRQLFPRGMVQNRQNGSLNGQIIQNAQNGAGISNGFQRISQTISRNISTKNQSFSSCIASSLPAQFSIQPSSARSSRKRETSTSENPNYQNSCQNSSQNSSCLQSPFASSPMVKRLDNIHISEEMDKSMKIVPQIAQNIPSSKNNSSTFSPRNSLTRQLSDGYQPESYKHVTGSYQPESYQAESYQPESYQPESYQPESYQPESYKSDTYQSDNHALLPEVVLAQQRLIPERLSPENPSSFDTRKTYHGNAVISQLSKRNKRDRSQSESSARVFPNVQFNPMSIRQTFVKLENVILEEKRLSSEEKLKTEGGVPEVSSSLEDIVPSIGTSIGTPIGSSICGENEVKLTPIILLDTKEKSVPFLRTSSNLNLTGSKTQSVGRDRTGNSTSTAKSPLKVGEQKISQKIRNKNVVRHYKCTWEGCDSAYTKSSHLKAHVRRHTVSDIKRCREKVNKMV